MCHQAKGLSLDWNPSTFKRDMCLALMKGNYEILYRYRHLTGVGPRDL